MRPTPRERPPGHAPRRFAFLLLATFALAALTGCSASRGVRPLGKGRTSAGLSVGGPLFTNLGPAMPAPLTSVHVRHGVGERTDLDVGLHLPVIGAAGIDFGASHLLLAQEGARPAVTAGGRAYLWASALALSGKKNPNTGRGYALEPRLYEELYARASWQLGENVLAWGGADLFVQLERLAVLPSLVAGAEWRPCRDCWIPGITLEARHAALFSNQRFEVVDYLGPAGFGAFGVHLALNFYPGAPR